MCAAQALSERGFAASVPDENGGGGEGGGGDRDIGMGRSSDSGDGSASVGGRTEIKVDENEGLDPNKSRDAEVDLVCATIEVRWLWPILQVVRDFEVSEWQLRFSADKCESMFMDTSHRMFVHNRWSCDSFYAYYVCTTSLYDSEDHADPTATVASLSEVASPTIVTSVCPDTGVILDAIVRSTTTTPPSPPLFQTTVTLHTAVASEPQPSPTKTRVPNVCTRMNVNVAHLFKLLLCDATQSHNRATFRVGSRGTCSIQIDDGTPLEWKQASHEPEDDTYDIPHLDMPFRSFDSQIWRSFWNDLPPGDIVRLRQNADTLTLESSSKGIVTILDNEIASVTIPTLGPVDNRSPPLVDVSEGASEATITLDGQLLGSFRHLDDYKFVTGRIHVRCTTNHPLYIGYDIDEASAVAAHTRPLQFLYPTLPNVLVDLVHGYFCVPHLNSSVNAFVAPFA
jgi:hypothetical protein